MGLNQGDSERLTLMFFGATMRTLTLWGVADSMRMIESPIVNTVPGRMLNFKTPWVSGTKWRSLNFGLAGSNQTPSFVGRCRMKP